MRCLQQTEQSLETHHIITHSSSPVPPSRTKTAFLLDLNRSKAACRGLDKGEVDVDIDIADRVGRAKAKRLVDHFMGCLRIVITFSKAMMMTLAKKRSFFSKIMQKLRPKRSPTGLIV